MNVKCLKVRSNSIFMQHSHANFYLDRISLGIIQEFAALAHPTPLKVGFFIYISKLRYEHYFPI
ncbi:hypothetical protein C9J47_16910 [Photobacterium indicum]|uniref:Uncharacterized protein n=1 Tax=Photobacterium indicum TaxID=81447 RepID=A0A2T3L6H6_9GAMM|nr:hypothetical protein C9J47_16910 [Photobacterium indicum]